MNTTFVLVENDKKMELGSIFLTIELLCYISEEFA